MAAARHLGVALHEIEEEFGIDRRTARRMSRALENLFPDVETRQDEARFTYGSINLLGGIPCIVAMIGFFGVAEALVQLENIGKTAVRQSVSRIVPAWRDVRRYLRVGLRASACWAMS